MKMSHQNKYIDLHLHTTASDGTSTVEEIMRDAADANLSAIAITDHDNIDAINRAIEIGKSLNIEVIPGIEFSATFETQEVHILGYLFDHKRSSFLRDLKKIQTDRMNRLKLIVNKLQGLDLGIEAEEVLALSGKGSPGRLHIARILVQKNIVKNIQEAFSTYLGYGKKAYVDRTSLPAKEAIRIIRESHGIPVIAHPPCVDEGALIRKLTDLGLLGIEAYHPSFSAGASTQLEKIAYELDLIVTGGSDCHGLARGSKKIIGAFKVPYTLLQMMKLKKIGVDQNKK